MTDAQLNDLVLLVAEELNNHRRTELSTDDLYRINDVLSALCQEFDIEVVED